MVAAVDPDPRVDGKGIARLRAAGMTVDVGCLEDEARRQNAGFFLRMCQRRPFVALKLATSADGRIATATGDSQWITGPAARAEGHRLRLRHDAILVGSGTALADDPMLTCRLPGLEGRSPVRVVVDRRLRLRAGSRLARSAGRPAGLAVHARHGRAGQRRAAGRGRHAVVAWPSTEPDAVLHEVLAALADQGITRVLVEGGATLATGLPARETRRPALPVRGAAADRWRRLPRDPFAGGARPGRRQHAGAGSRSGCWARTGSSVLEPLTEER